MSISILAENFFSTAQFTRHVLADVAPAVDHGVFRVGTARRGEQNFAQRDSASDQILSVATDRVRTADTLVIDRNSDIAGRSNFRLQISSDSALTLNDIIAGAIGAADQVVLGSSMDDPENPILTDEGAFIFSFPEVAANFWQLRITTGGTPTKIGGAYLGKRYTPALPRLPFDDESAWAAFGSVGRGIPDNDWRAGKSMRVNALVPEAEWNEARRVRELLKRGHPAWVFPPKAERSGLYYLEGGTFSAPTSESPMHRTMALQLSEYQPLRPQ